MDLHELLSTAVADLPDLPDQVPAAQRIHHRRRVMARRGAVAAAAALVVGVGTLTIAAPWNSRSSAVAVSVATSHAPATPLSSTGIAEYDPGARHAAPALSGVTLAGAAYSTSYSGHVTVIEVWGSWCTPCRKEGQTLAQAYQKDRSAGVQFLGIDGRDDNAAAERFQAEFGIGYPSLRDPNATLMQQLSLFVPADALPSLVIVDPNGKVAVAIVGIVTATELDRQIAYAR